MRNQILPVCVCGILLLGFVFSGGCTSLPPEPEKGPSGPPNLLVSPPGEWVSLFDGSSLKGWGRVGDAEGDGYGRVHVENGTIVLEMGDPMTGIVWKSGFPRNAYEVYLEANRLDGFDFFCGMTFPVDDSFCTLIMGGWGGSIVGLSNVDDFAADNNETTKVIDFDNGKWYKIRLRVTTEAIEVWLGEEKPAEEKIIDLKRTGHRFSIWPEQEPVRPFGVSTWNTKAALRNFKFRNL